MVRISRKIAAAAAVMALTPALASAALVSYTTSGVFNASGATGVTGAAGNVLTVAPGATITFNGANVVNAFVSNSGQFSSIPSFGSFTFAGDPNLRSFSGVGFTLSIAQSQPTPVPPGTAAFPSTVSGFLESTGGTITLTFSSPLSQTIMGGPGQQSITYRMQSQTSLGNGTNINGDAAVAPLPIPAAVGMATLGLVGWARRKRQAKNA